MARSVSSRSEVRPDRRGKMLCSSSATCIGKVADHSSGGVANFIIGRSARVCEAAREAGEGTNAFVAFEEQIDDIRRLLRRTNLYEHGLSMHLVSFPNRKEPKK